MKTEPEQSRLVVFPSRHRHRLDHDHRHDQLCRRVHSSYFMSCLCWLSCWFVGIRMVSSQKQRNQRMDAAGKCDRRNSSFVFSFFSAVQYTAVFHLSLVK